MEVFVNKDEFAKQLAEVPDMLEGFFKSVQGSEEVVNSMYINWSDDVYRAFITKMNDFYAELYKFATSLESYTDFVNVYYKSVSTLDEVYSKKHITLV